MMTANVHIGMTRKVRCVLSVHRLKSEQSLRPFPRKTIPHRSTSAILDQQHYESSIMASTHHPTTAVEALQNILHHHNQRLKPSPCSAQPSCNQLGDTRASSLDLVPSNAAFPIVETTTANCVQRKSTERLFEPAGEPVLRRWMRACTWPVSKGFEQIFSSGTESGRDRRG